VAWAEQVSARTGPARQPIAAKAINKRMVFLRGCEAD
jgi:hypothetical protein